MTLKVKLIKDARSKFQYFWDTFVSHRMVYPRKGDTAAQDPQTLARAAFEAGWEAAGGAPHKDRAECKHTNVRGIAVVQRPCPSCGKPVF